MTSALYDFAIIGESAASKLLAGLLTRDHKRRCVLLGDNEIRVRLPKSGNASFAPLTRPEHWAMLAQTSPETLKLLSRLGAKNTVQRCSALCLAQNQASREALSHIRTTAEFYGHTIEVLSPSLLPSDSIGFYISDIAHVDSVGVDEHLTRWLDDLGVVRASRQGLKLLKDGSSTLQTEADTLAFRQTILLDDQAVIDHLPISQWPRIAHRKLYSSLLVTPNQPLAAPILFEIDSGATLAATAGRGVNLIAPGDNAQAYADTHRLLASVGGGDVLGQRSFTRLVIPDGLPAFGRVGISTGADVVLAAEHYALFIVPALARWIGGVASDAENTYFAERLVTRSPKALADAVPTRLMSTS
jgi:hypothetical protein